MRSDTRFLLLSGLVGVAALPLAAVVTVAVVLVAVLVGGPLLALLLPAVRGLASAQRQLTGERVGRALPDPYAPAGGAVADDLVTRLREEATWRDLAWLWAQGVLSLPALLLWWVPGLDERLAGAVTTVSTALLSPGPTAAPGPVADTGDDAATAPPFRYGLVGMRERIALLGGTMHAGPREPAGWEVVASLPLPRADPGAPPAPTGTPDPVPGVEGPGTLSR